MSTTLMILTAANAVLLIILIMLLLCSVLIFNVAMSFALMVKKKISAQPDDVEDED